MFFGTKKYTFQGFGTGTFTFSNEDGENVQYTEEDLKKFSDPNNNQMAEYGIALRDYSTNVDIVEAKQNGINLQLVIEDMKLPPEDFVYHASGYHANTDEFEQHPLWQRYEYASLGMNMDNLQTFIRLSHTKMPNVDFTVLIPFQKKNYFPGYREEMMVKPEEFVNMITAGTLIFRDPIEAVSVSSNLQQALVVKGCYHGPQRSKTELVIEKGSLRHIYVLSRTTKSTENKLSTKGMTYFYQYTGVSKSNGRPLYHFKMQYVDAKNQELVDQNQEERKMDADFLKTFMQQGRFWVGTGDFMFKVEPIKMMTVGQVKKELLQKQM